MQKTLAIIKPDGLLGNYTDDIKRTILEYGFNIVKEKTVQLNDATVKRFYAEHSSKSFFSSLVKYMTRYPILASTLDAWWWYILLFSYKKCGPICETVVVSHSIRNAAAFVIPLR
jgi:hypothetical protein